MLKNSDVTGLSIFTSAHLDNLAGVLCHDDLAVLACKLQPYKVPNRTIRLIHQHLGFI